MSIFTINEFSEIRLTNYNYNFSALSRHSLHPLVGYASKEVGNELGYVREVQPAELEKFLEENQKIMATRL